MTAPDSRSQVQAFLHRQGLLAEGADAELTPLTGGVSSDLWRVDLPGGRSVCVKSALAQLKVEREWHAPVSRNRVEHDWLRFAAGVAPGQVPRVLAHDGDAGLFAMEFLPPEHYPVWKSHLLAGRVDVDAAAAVGDLVGRLHSASAAAPDTAAVFATDDNFEALRIEPYLRATARVHPDLRERFDALIPATTGTHLAVVHGDVSPKNILLGPDGPVLLDAECAWFGDPAFDLAFCLNHLLLKAVKLPHRAATLRASAQALAAAHARHLDWEPPQAFDGRVAALLPALALARVDGTSPVEYLDTAQRQHVRATARTLLREPAPTVAEVLARWTRERHSATA
ncbi:aminoglycoside phosphotransferase [Actinobacteria bacterium OK074]|nr:aminoglycoside phosphotransferase [Actinobacteria bacterium OK074]